MDIILDKKQTVLRSKCCSIMVIFNALMVEILCVLTEARLCSALTLQYLW